ncbi:Alpha/Beta hydrolase fold [Amanita muscaria]
MRQRSYFLSAVAALLPTIIPSIAAPTDIPSAASFYVPSIPDIHQDSVHPLRIYAGNLLSDPRATSQSSSTEVFAHLYFVLVQNRRTADRERVMFWFNGGPGCSSFDGLMMEVGPWRYNGKGGFQVKEGGWEEYTTIIYVDQPAGTGFSYTSTDHFISSPTEAAEQFLVFLRNLYKVFPQYINMDTYLGGESFAGQWIPFFANAILDSDLGVPLKGAAIGNGWIDPRRQYPAYLDYAVKMRLLEENTELWKKSKSAVEKCTQAYSKLTHEPMSVHECSSILFDVSKVREKKVNGTQMCINIYDIRLDDTKPSCGMNWPPDIKPITTYLDRTDVVSALHATGHSGSWVECRGIIHQHFDEYKLNASIVVLPKVLSKIPVLVFAGDQDLICNYLGLEAMMKAMTWNGHTGMGKVETQSWNVDKTPAGTWVTSRNLTYVKIFNASHMAPYDVPHITHDMILRFMGVNFSAIVDGSARIPSSVGTETKPVFIATSTAKSPNVPVSGKTPEQDKAMWEAYYNAGSAAIILVLIFLGIGVFLWCRVRRRKRVKLGEDKNEEENIPLTHPNGLPRDEDESNAYLPRQSSKGKGKERAVEVENGYTMEQDEAVFEVGSDDEDTGRFSGRSPHTGRA